MTRVTGSLRLRCCLPRGRPGLVGRGRGLPSSRSLRVKYVCLISKHPLTFIYQAKEFGKPRGPKPPPKLPSERRSRQRKAAATPVEEVEKIDENDDLIEEAGEFDEVLDDEEDDYGSRGHRDSALPP